MANRNISIVPGMINLSFHSPTKKLHYFRVAEKPTFFSTKKNKAAINLKINIVARKKILASTDKYIWQFNQRGIYTSGDNILYASKFFGIPLTLFIENISGDEIRALVSYSYFFSIRYRFEHVFPPLLHLSDLIFLKAIDFGDGFIYGASLIRPNSDEGILILGPSGCGKSSATMSLLSIGYKHLGEDLSYYDHFRKVLRGVPHTSTWHHHIKRNLFSKNSNIKTPYSPDSSEGKLTRIYLSEPAEINKITKVKFTLALFHKLMNLQRSNIQFGENLLWRIFSFRNSNSMDIEKLTKQEEKLLFSLYEEKTFYIVNATSPSEFVSLILDEEERARKDTSIKEILK